MSREDAVATGAADAGSWSPEADLCEWLVPGDAAALAKIEEGRCQLHERMAEFVAIVRAPERHQEALQLLLLIIDWAEALYWVEDSLCGRDAHGRTQRERHRAVLHDLHVNLARLAAHGVAGDAFDLVHAIDALLIHEWVVGTRMDLAESITVRQAGDATTLAQTPPGLTQPVDRHPAH
jgi:hypothetical protein